MYLPGQAETALNTDETPVGCVFVNNGKVIGRGMNYTNETLNVRLILLLCCLSTYVLY